MKILEMRDGKLIAEIDGKYPTRVVCSDNGLHEFRGNNDKNYPFVHRIVHARVDGNASTGVCRVIPIRGAE